MCQNITKSGCAHLRWCASGDLSSEQAHKLRVHLQKIRFTSLMALSRACFTVLYFLMDSSICFLNDSDSVWASLKLVPALASLSSCLCSRCTAASAASRALCLSASACFCACDHRLRLILLHALVRQCRSWCDLRNLCTA